MYTKYHKYAWREAREKLEFEIGKAEGQLRNCRNRMDLAKREMMICIMTFIIGVLIFGAREIVHFRESRLTYLVSDAIASWLLYIVYLNYLDELNEKLKAGEHFDNNGNFTGQFKYKPFNYLANALF